MHCPVRSGFSVSQSIAEADYSVLATLIQQAQAGIANANNASAYANSVVGEFGEHAITRSATIKIASSNATAKSKVAADYVCDGITDDVQINAAITSLTTTGGCIELSEGTFVGSVLINTSNIWLKGQGISTILDGDIIVQNISVTIISDFKITGGDYDGIYNTVGGNLKIFNCDIGNASAAYDGIYNAGSLLVCGNTITTIKSNANIKPSTALAIADINNIDVVNIDIT